MVWAALAVLGAEAIREDETARRAEEVAAAEAVLVAEESYPWSYTLVVTDALAYALRELLPLKVKADRPRDSHP